MSNHSTYVSKACTCGRRMRRVDKRCRFCPQCVAARFVARSRSVAVRAKLRALQIEREAVKLTAIIDAELASPTRYWESPS